MDKLDEFSLNGPKNTDGLTLLSGFPSNQKPARQWFNWLFNSITKKINEIIDSKLDANANAVSAAKLETGRKITFTGVVKGSQTFDGSQDISIDTSFAAALGVKAIAVIRLNGSSYQIVKHSGFSSVSNIGGGQIEFTLSTAAPDTDFGILCTGSSNNTDAVSLQERADFVRTTTKFCLMGAHGGDNTQGAYTPQVCTVVVFY
ncbi:hypothetical protein [Acinetobacter oleivorans]|uniref:hypothetical protein n=1 Tax=Acinetobacter oleivorans TaxID=1148157 RepID=UPI00124FC71E|nr:hypothetical protein [Acinetobacter oleivorans]